ncbi:MAG: DsbA family protein [Oliverpabstia sp.]
MSLKIQFVTDYVCPYCMVAKVPFMQAIQGKDVEVEWIPYELTQEPDERIDTYHDEIRKEKWAKTLVPKANALGIDMKLPPKVIPRPYTRLAFEGYHYAKEHGQGEEYNTRVFHAYFCEELDIGNPEVLCKIAKESGLEVDSFRKALENGTYTALQKNLVAYARDELHVQSVPTIFLGNTMIEINEYTKEAFVEIIDHALKEYCEKEDCK